MSDSSPCVPVAPSTNTGYTVSFVLLLAVIVEFDANVAVTAFPEHAADVPELVIYPAPLVIALLFSDMFAVPSNDTPAIVLAFANAVAVAALPVHEPDEPEVLPVTLPVNDAVIVPAEKSPELSLNTIVLPVLAFVALDVTVNVPPSEFTQPDKPFPDVAPFST